MKFNIKIPVLLSFLFTISYGSHSSQFQFEQINPEKSQVHFTLDEFKLVSEDGLDRIQSGAISVSLDEGLPEMPVYSFLFEIDPDRDYTVNYQILQTHSVDNVNLYPSHLQNLGEIQQTSSPVKDASFYSSDSVYPENILEISEPQIMRDLTLFSISLTPFQYNPATRTLDVFDEVLIELNSAETARTGSGPRQIPASRTFSKLYENNVINYDRNRSISDTPVILYIAGGNSLSTPYVQALINWRHQRGYQVEAVSASSIGGSASSIKSYIQSAYNNWENPPDYVCLIGDSGGSYNIPAFYENWSGYNGEGDHPYTQLSGNDLLSDIILGRMSVRSTTDLAVVVNKIISYEKGVDLGSNWTEKAALAGDPDPSGISTVITNESIENMMEQYDMEDVRHKYSGGSWASWMQNQLNEGVLYFNYRGYYGVSGFGNGNVDGANNGYKLTFATVITCGTGSFASQNTALSEKFFRAGTVSNPKGAVASIGTATTGTHTLFNNIFDLGVYYGLFALGNETAGEALNSGKYALYETYPSNPNNFASIFTHWNNLMGDPATHLWTDTPTEINVEYPETLNWGQDVIQVLVTDQSNAPVEDARVTLVMGDDDIFSNTFTDENGSALIPVDFSTSGNIDITVTKRNIIPFTGEISIPSNGIDLEVVDDEIIFIDDGTQGTDGNGDGNVNPGETFLIDIPLYNLSDSPIVGLDCSLSTLEQYLEILDPPVNIPFLPGNEHQSIQFLCSLSPSAEFRQDLDVILDIQTGNEGSWNMMLPVEIYGPSLSIDSIVISGGVSDLVPGGTGTMQISLVNNGSEDINNITGELITGNDELIVISGALSWSNIEAGTSEFSEEGIVVNVDSNIVNGTNLGINLHLVNPDGYDHDIVFHTMIGELTETDPMGPDDYGYYIYDMADSGYDLAPVYDWIEIDPQYGGAGSELPIDDGGNNQDDSYVLSLPFTFKFYGLDYNQVTVCSNGWISFGNSDLESFRNYHIPGPGGPSPMLAVFWDDLKTTNGGAVYGYYDSGNGQYIIEWSDVRTFDQNSVESFQAILFENMVPPFGDNEIKLQYKEFNNTTNGSYSWGTPVHGAYCTIGIENHLSDTGLEYTFNNEYPVAASPLYDGSALWITTRVAEVLPIPQVSVNFDIFGFEMNPDDVETDHLILTNTGEPESVLYYALQELPLMYPAGAPDDFGHFWTDSDTDPDMDMNWVDITANGETVVFQHNDIAADPVDIGFEFPFYGENYDQCIISPNGWIGFGEDNNDWQNGHLPSEESPRPAIFPFWDDLNPVNDGNSPDMEGYVYYFNTDEYFVVWFDHVAHWNGEIQGNYNFQAILFPNGDIRFNYDALDGTINRSTVGIQNGNGDDGIEIVMDEEYVHENLSVLIKQSAEWMDIIAPDDQFSGGLNEGESVDFILDIQSSGLEFGDYSTHIKLTTNSQPPMDIPVNLTVSELIEQPGDLDQDGVLNVIDIVILVNIITGEIIPDDYQLWAADLNEDAIIDVLDIVQLVGIILDQ